MTLLVRHATTAVHSARNSMLLLSMLIAGAPAMAQTCVTPVAWPASGLPLGGTTCGGEHVVDSFCNDLHDNPGPNVVIQFVLDDNASSIMLSGGAPGFDPVMYLSDAADSCDAADCLASGDRGVPISLVGLPPGAYRLTIAASGTNDPGACGSFALTADGDLSGNDIIFADGFE